MAAPVTAPVIVQCPPDQWTIVATGTTGQIHRMLNGPMYLQTYRPTGQGAPAASPSEGVVIFESSDHAGISFSSIADIYIWCNGGAGIVRVDV